MELPGEFGAGAKLMVHRTTTTQKMVKINNFKGQSLGVKLFHLSIAMHAVGTVLAAVAAASNCVS